MVHKRSCWRLVEWIPNPRHYNQYCKDSGAPSTLPFRSPVSQISLQLNALPGPILSFYPLIPSHTLSLAHLIRYTVINAITLKPPSQAVQCVFIVSETVEGLEAVTCGAVNRLAFHQKAKINGNKRKIYPAKENSGTCCPSELIAVTTATLVENVHSNERPSHVTSPEPSWSVQRSYEGGVLPFGEVGKNWL